MRKRKEIANSFNVGRSRRPCRIVDVLTNSGADLQATLSSGFGFVLRRASRPSRSSLATAQAGCDVNSVMHTQSGTRFGKNRFSATPLILAIENGHFDLAKTLLDVGADPNADPAGYTALHALTWVRKPIRGDGDPPPRGSGKINSLDMVRILVASKADLNARLKNGKSELGRFTYTGSTPFLLAAQASDVALVKLLVELGADPNIRTRMARAHYWLLVASVLWVMAMNQPVPKKKSSRRSNIC